MRSGKLVRMEQEHPLAGGNVAAGVVRVGSTVRKPWSASTPSVVEFMTAVREHGVDVPMVLGRDELGRQMLEHIPGRLALEADPLTERELGRVGGIVRAIHDASEQFRPSAGACWTTAIPAPGNDIVCHNDLAPWNLIIGERWVFIDWDAAAPSTRLWDLAFSAQAFTLSDHTQPADEAARRLAAFVDGYRADDSLRAQLPATMQLRTAAMYELLRSSHKARREPWGSMYVDGHGVHWSTVREYVTRHQEVWAEALRSADR